MTVDEGLLRDMASGDQRAFETIFDTYTDYVFNIAFRRTGSGSVSEDIVADVFAELWRQRDRIRPRHGSLRPWLAGVAANKARRHWRSAERESSALRRVHAQGDAPSSELSADVAARLDDTDRAARLAEALAELPAGQLDVITLSVWEELTHAEIAEALDVAVGTVKSRLARARRTLEDAIGTPGPERAWKGNRPLGVAGEPPTNGSERDSS